MIKAMRLYNYLIYRIYYFYIDIIKENDLPFFITSIVITILVFFNIFSIYGFIVNLYKIYLINEIFYLISIWILIFIFNYIIIVKPGYFLEMNFNKTKKGTLGVLLYILLSIVLFIIVAEINRSNT